MSNQEKFIRNFFGKEASNLLKKLSEIREINICDLVKEYTRNGIIDDPLVYIDDEGNPQVDEL